MRSRIVLAAVALLLVSALPAFAALPFGSLDGKVQPISGNGAYGLLHGTGWACDDSGIASVDIFVDGIPQVRAFINKLRPGVTRKFPACTAPGFIFAVDTTTFLNGVHNMTAVATANDGGQRTLGPIRLQFLNAPHILKPFGIIVFPDPDAVMHGRCNLADPTRRYSVLEGVAFDSGIHSDDTGVHNVDLLIDGSRVFSTRTDCRFIAAAGGMSNCFGLPSPGWTALYPSLPDSDNATFRFVIDVGALIGFGYTEGAHKITIRADDYAGYYKNIDNMNVVFACDENNPNEPSFGQIEAPVNEQPYKGTVTVSGWALDIDGIATNGIEVRVNDTLDGTTNPTVPRPDVASRYPGYPVVNSGFTYQLDTTKYPDGLVTIELWVTDVHGARTLIGEKKLIFSNRVGP